MTHLSPGSFSGCFTLNCLYLPPCLSSLPPHGSGARMSFLSCCKCGRSLVRRGILDSASKKRKKRQSPHALICLIAAFCFATSSSNQSVVGANLLWEQRENSAARTANPSHPLPQTALHGVDRRAPVSNYYSRGCFW